MDMIVYLRKKKRGVCVELDYHIIGQRVARRRKELCLTQARVAEQCGISDQYLSNIERAVSIPSTEVVMRLAAALDTTPDEFLVGTARHPEEKWRDTAERLRGLGKKQLELADSFLDWLSQQKL